MDATSHKFTSVDEYHATFPAGTRAKLQQMRTTIKKAAPKAEEVISYNMSAFKQDGILVFYAGYKGHIGFYPGAVGIENFKKELSVYKWAKGSVQFPLDEPLPLALVTQIVKFRVAQNEEKAKGKVKKKK